MLGSVDVTEADASALTVSLSVEEEEDESFSCDVEGTVGDAVSTLFWLSDTLDLAVSGRLLLKLRDNDDDDDSIRNTKLQMKKTH